MAAAMNILAMMPVVARLVASKGPTARTRVNGARKPNVIRFDRRIALKTQSKSQSKSQVDSVAAETAVATEFDFAEYMKQKAAITEKALDESVTQQYPDSVHESMRYSLLAGGKRIRPALCIAACEMFTDDSSVAMPTACALEMIHTMSLMHDDLPCMDNDDFRRGSPTNHKVYGEQCAILAGDGLLTRAFEYIAMATPLDKVDPRIVLRVVAYVAKCVGSEGLVGGQIVDIEMEGVNRGGTPASLETLQYIHAHKTAALLDAAVVCGALLGGADEEDIARLTRYAQDIGLAFQVIDDILDCTLTSEQLGKTAGKDEAVGKTTYPSLLGLDESRRIAKQLIDDAKAELAIYNPEKAAPLLALADYIGSRQN